MSSTLAFSDLLNDLGQIPAQTDETKGPSSASTLYFGQLQSSSPSLHFSPDLPHLENLLKAKLEARRSRDGSHLSQHCGLCPASSWSRRKSN